MRTNLHASALAGSDFAQPCGNNCTVDTTPICNIINAGNHEDFQNCEKETKFSIDSALCSLCEGRIKLPVWEYISEFEELQGVTMGLSWKEIQTISANGGTISKKVFMPKNAKAIVVQPNENHMVYYKEKTEVFANQIVTTDVDNAKVIPVKDASKYMVGALAMVDAVDTTLNASVDANADKDSDPKTCPTCTISTRVKIESVDFTNNTITVDTPVTILAGTRFVQLWSQLKGCELPALYEAKNYWSYVGVYTQLFGKRFSVKHNILNKCYTAGTLSDKLKEIVVEPLKLIAQEVMYAELVALNIPETSTQAREAQGILPLIQYHNDMGVENYYDLSQVPTIHRKAEEFLKIMNRVQKGLNEDIMIITTYAGFEEYARLTQKFATINGAQIMISENESDTYNYRIKEYRGLYGTGKLKIMVHSGLEQLYKDKKILVYFMENRHFVLDPIMPTITDSAGVTFSTMSNIKIEDINVLNIGKPECDKEFSMWFELGFATQGAGDGKVGIIQL